MPRPTEEWLKYCEKVDVAGGLKVIGEEDVARDHNGDLLENGIFDVAKPK